MEVERQKLISENEKKERSKDDKINELLHKVESLEKSQKDEVEKAVSEKNIKIAELQGKIDNAEIKAKNMVSEAIAKEREVQEKLRLEKTKLEGELANKEEEKKLALKLKDDEIATYKDFKARLSTKEIG